MAIRWVVGGIWVILMAAGVLTCGLYAVAEQPRTPGKILISDVIISGNRRMSTEQIKARLRSQPGSEYNPAIVDEDVRQLFKFHQFRSIHTDLRQDGRGEVKLIISVREMPNMVKKVTFLGAKHLKKEKLFEATGVREGMPLNPNLNRNGCQKIQEKYMEMGRTFADCQLIKGGDLGDTEVVYQITEGPKIKVRNIRFTGNTFVTSNRLATQLKSSKEGFSLIGGTYNKTMAEAGKQELMKYYRRYGYQDVRVALETQRSTDGGSVTLIYHIHEGPRYRRKDDSRKGCLECTSGNILSVNRDHLQKPVRIGNIYVTGNKRISSESIFVHVPLFPGNVLSYTDLQQAEQNLAALGLFVVDDATGVRPTITMLDVEGDSDWKDLLITVKEKPEAKRKSVKRP